MTIKINYSKNVSGKPSSNLVLFVDEKFSLNKLKKYFSNVEYAYVNDLLRASDLKKNI